MFYSPSALSPISPIYPSVKEKETPPINSNSKDAPPVCEMAPPTCEMTPPASASSSLMDEHMSTEIIFEKPAAAVEMKPASLPSNMETAQTSSMPLSSASPQSQSTSTSTANKEDDDDDEMDIDSASSASSVCEWTLNFPKQPLAKPQVEPVSLSQARYTYPRSLPPQNPSSSPSPSLPTSTLRKHFNTSPTSPSNALPLRPNLPALTLRIPNSSLGPANRKPERQFEALRLMVNASPYPRAQVIPEGWGRSSV